MDYYITDEDCNITLSDLLEGYWFSTLICSAFFLYLSFNIILGIKDSLEIVRGYLLFMCFHLHVDVLLGVLFKRES